jgi:hypothetical protein
VSSDALEELGKKKLVIPYRETDVTPCPESSVTIPECPVVFPRNRSAGSALDPLIAG